MALAKVKKRSRAGKRPDELPWSVCYRVTDKKTGKRVTKWSTPPSGLREDARALAATITAELHGGRHTPPGQSLTVAKAAELWRDEEIENQYSNGVIGLEWRDALRSIIKTHIIPSFRTQLLCDLTRLDVQKWMDGKSKEKYRRRPGTAPRKFSKRYLTKMKTAIKMLCDYGMEQGWLARSPFEGKRIRILRKGDPERYVPTLDEVAALLRAAQVTRWPVDGAYRAKYGWTQRHAVHARALIVLIAAFCGLRGGEISALKWDDVDFEARVLRVDESLARRGLKGPKAERSRRRVPMNVFVEEALLAHATRIRERTGKEPSGFVLVNKLGRPFARSYVTSYHFPKLMRACGFVDADGEPRFTPHALRHHAGSVWLSLGFPLELVARMLGHSVQMCADVYAHHMPHDRRGWDAVDAAARLLVAGIRENGEEPPLALPVPIAPDPAGPIIEAEPVFTSVAEALPLFQPPSPTRVEVRAAKRERVRELLAAGKRKAAISREVGVSLAAVDMWLAEGKAPKAIKPGPPADEAEAAARTELKARVIGLYRDGVPPSEIVAATAVGFGTVKHWVSRAGLQWNKLGYGACSGAERDKNVTSGAQP